MSDLTNITEATPMSDEEALLEAQAWRFDTVEEWLKAMDEAGEQYEAEQ